MRYLSVASGIEAATVAWYQLGWSPFAFSEIAAFPSAVLSHHYSKVPNLGDMTKFQEWPELDANGNRVDILVGGTPCQSFSVSGLRKGLADPRGNLCLTFLGIADKYRPKWIVWENVPGVLSSNGGRDFGSFLGALVKLGYGFAYRVLDARYFGLAQTRRRVFVVASLGSWGRAAAVLFEREGMFRIPAKVRNKNESDAGLRNEIRCLSCGVMWEPDGGLEFCPVCGSQQSWCAQVCGTLSDGAHMGGGLNEQDACSGRLLVHAGLPRRLTVTECEILQGFSAGYTAIPYKKGIAPDGPRFKAVMNSMPVPVMRWIGEGIRVIELISPSW